MATNKNKMPTQEIYETPLMCFYKTMIFNMGEEPSKEQTLKFLSWCENSPEEFNEWYNERKELVSKKLVEGFQILEGIAKLKLTQ